MRDNSSSRRPLIGDYDARMRGRLLDELSRTTYVPRLIVDLTPCTFIDATIIATLLRCRRFGARQVELVVPDEGQVSRALGLAGVDILACVHRTWKRLCAASRACLGARPDRSVAAAADSSTATATSRRR